MDSDVILNIVRQEWEPFCNVIGDADDSNVQKLYELSREGKADDEIIGDLAGGLPCDLQTPLLTVLAAIKLCEAVVALYDEFRQQNGRVPDRRELERSVHERHANDKEFQARIRRVLSKVANVVDAVVRLAR